MDWLETIWKTLLACCQLATACTNLWAQYRTEELNEISEEVNEIDSLLCIRCGIRNREMGQFPCGHCLLCKICATQQHWQYRRKHPNPYVNGTSKKFKISVYKAYVCPYCRKLSWPVKLKGSWWWWGGVSQTSLMKIIIMIHLDVLSAMKNQERLFSFPVDIG